MEIRGFTLQYSKRKAKKYRDEKKSLLKKVNDLQAKAESNPCDVNTRLELEHARLHLRKIMASKTKGSILSKARWYEQGECNTKYFYSLE